MHLVNHADDVVTEHLEQRFVNLGGRQMTSHEASKLPLNRREGRLGVGPLMVGRPELVAMQRELMEQPVPQRRRAGARRTEFEGNERRGASGVDGFKIRLRLAGDHSNPIF